MSGLFEKVKLIDMFGKPVTLNVFGKKRHKTHVGAFITLCSVIFFVSVIQNRLINFFKRQEIIASQHVSQDQIRELNLDPSNFMTAIKFNFPQGVQSFEGQPFTFKISQVEQQIIHQTQTSPMKILSQNTTTTMIPCTLEHFASQQKSELNDIQLFFQDQGIESYFCPDIQLNFTLQGNRNTEHYKYMKPITEMYFQQNDIESDESWFWFASSRFESFVIYSEEEFRENMISQSQAPISQKNYGQFYFFRSQYTINSKRQYEKVDGILSYMGGFIQIVFIFTGFLMEFYNMQSLMMQLANQLYSFETPTELKKEDKDILNFHTKQDFLRNIYSQIFSQVEKLNLNLKYILYLLSCRKLFKNGKNMLIHEVMKQVDKDLNIFEILDRLHEVDKMKKVLFTEEQKKIFEFSYKPTFNFESIQNNLKVKKLQEIEKKRMEKNRKIRNREERKIQKKIQSQIQSQIKIQKKLCLEDQQDFPINKNTPVQTKNKLEIPENNNLTKKSLVDIVAQVSYFKNKDNLKKVQQISNLLLLEGQSLLNKTPANTLAKPQQTTETFYCLNNLSQTGINNYQGTFNNINQKSQSQQISPLKQYLMQNKKKKNENFLLSLIQVLRPQTFYSQRMDYSQFSSFYELYEAYEQATNAQLNNRSQIKVTQKILQFLGQDIRDVFKLAEKLPTEESLSRQERINMLVQLFVCNLKQKIGRESFFCLTKVNEEVLENDQKGYDIQSNYQFKINKMNQLNEKSEQYLRGKNTQSLMNSSNLSSIHQNPETFVTVLDQSQNFPKYFDRSNNNLSMNKQDSESSSQYSPTRFSQRSSNKNSNLKKKNQNDQIQSNKSKRFSLQYQYVNSDKQGIILHQIAGVKPSNSSSIFRQNFQQKIQPKSIVELYKFDQNATSQSSDETHIIQKQISNASNIIEKGLKNVKFQITIDEDQAEQSHSFNNIKIDQNDQNNNKQNVNFFNKFD